MLRHVNYGRGVAKMCNGKICSWFHTPDKAAKAWYDEVRCLAYARERLVAPTEEARRAGRESVLITDNLLGRAECRLKHIIMQRADVDDAAAERLRVAVRHLDLARLPARLGGGAAGARARARRGHAPGRSRRGWQPVGHLRHRGHRQSQAGSGAAKSWIVVVVVVVVVVVIRGDGSAGGDATESAASTERVCGSGSVAVIAWRSW